MVVELAGGSMDALENGLVLDIDKVLREVSEKFFVLLFDHYAVGNNYSDFGHPLFDSVVRLKNGNYDIDPATISVLDLAGAKLSLGSAEQIFRANLSDYFTKEEIERGETKVTQLRKVYEKVSKDKRGGVSEEKLKDSFCMDVELDGKIGDMVKTWKTWKDRDYKPKHMFKGETEEERIQDGIRQLKEKYNELVRSGHFEKKA